MGNKSYEITLEISGPTAMWTRPDTGDVPASYPAPTYGAVKGIFECILLSDWAEVIPTKVEICRPIQFHVYNTNYGGPLRKRTDIIAGNSHQLLATVLINVCYRLYSELQPIPENYERRGIVEKEKQKTGTTNGAHAYQERFYQRLKKGQMHYMPCLGWKEFVPDYVGEFRSVTTVCKDVNIDIPSMLQTCFPNGRNSIWEPKFKPAAIRKGVLTYA